MTACDNVLFLFVVVLVDGKWPDVEGRSPGMHPLQACMPCDALL